MHCVNFINPRTTTRVTVSQVGSEFHCDLGLGDMELNLFADLCYTFDCDAHYVSRNGRTELCIIDQKTPRQRRTTSRIARARIKRLVGKLGHMKARLSGLLESICQFQSMRFMPNFTFETRGECISVICNMAHAHVLDLARLMNEHKIQTMTYTGGYLRCDLSERERKRSRSRDDDESRKRTRS